MAEAAIQISASIERVLPDTIRLERVLDAPPETVWRYLTKAELRQHAARLTPASPATGPTGRRRR